MRAETIGSRVPRTPCSGRVEAVFQHACNVALDAGGLVTVLAPHAGNVAHGVRLSRDVQFEFHMRRGMPVLMEENSIGFDDGVVEVALGGARTWTSPFRPGRCKWNPRSLRAASTVRDLLGREAAIRGSEFLARVQREDGLATPLAARIAQALPSLAHNARAGDCVGVLRQIARLVGLGPGLTPAGDDFIVGWLAGLALRADTPARLGLLMHICAGLAPLGAATSSVSRQHLQDACALAFSERLADLCLAIGDAAPAPRLATVVAAQLQVGASSGADAAAGLMFALFECMPTGRLDA